MVLCDTNVLIHAFNGRNDTLSRLEEIGLDQVVLSVVTVMELFQGCHNKVELAQLKRKIKYFDIVDLDNPSSKLALTLMERFRLSHGLQIPDTLIAATAIVNQIPLFTYNVKDFSFIPGITLI